MSTVTFMQVRQAFNILRAIDGFGGGAGEKQFKPLQAFEKNTRARWAAHKLMSAFREPIAFSEKQLSELRSQYEDRASGADEYGNLIFTDKEIQKEYKKREKDLLDSPVDGFDPDKVALKASVIGKKSLEIIPIDLLYDLGPFFVWDTEGDETK